MNLNQHIFKTDFHQFVTVATRGVGTRNRPISPLQLGVTDPEQILRTARMIRRSQSLPSLSDHEQLDGSLASSVSRKVEETWTSKDTCIVKFDNQTAQGLILSICSKTGIRYSALT